MVDADGGKEYKIPLKDQVAASGKYDWLKEDPLVPGLTIDGIATVEEFRVIDAILRDRLRARMRELHPGVEIRSGRMEVPGVQFKHSATRIEDMGAMKGLGGALKDYHVKLMNIGKYDPQWVRQLAQNGEILVAEYSAGIHSPSKGFFGRLAHQYGYYGQDYKHPRFTARELVVRQLSSNEDQSREKIADAVEQRNKGVYQRREHAVKRPLQGGLPTLGKKR